MDAIKLLKDQHREVESLFEQIDEARQDNEKLELFNRLADALAVHATIEEKIFYPASKRSRTEDKLREAVEEHLSAKRLIADIMEIEPSDEQWDAKVKVLKEQIEHHVGEEEGELFPEAKKFLGTRRLDALGIEMEAMATELFDEGEPREEIPTETAEPAPI